MIVYHRSICTWTLHFILWQYLGRVPSDSEYARVRETVMASNPRPTGQSQALVREALAKFERAASDDHRVDFSRAGIEDVWKAVKALEDTLASEQRSQNFRKLQCLLDRLRRYSKAAEKLHIDQKTLCWSWVRSNSAEQR